MKLQALGSKKFANVIALARFGKFLFTRKSTKPCEQEFSNESFFQPLLLAPEPSYGQTNLLSRYLWQITDVKPASPDTVDGQIVQSIPRKKLPLSNLSQSTNNEAEEEKHLGKKRFGRLHFQTVKIRLTNTLYEFWANPRLRTGLILLLLIAPLSKFFYLLFPEKGFGTYLINNEYLQIPNLVEGSQWYFSSLFYFFFSLSEFMTPLFSTIGLFFLFPKNYYPSYLCGIPAGYYAALLVNRTMVNSNLDFHSPVAISFILVGILFMSFIFYISDKMLFKTNHRKRAIEARILGLINMPGMSWEEKEALLKKEAKEAMKANNELFSRIG